MSRVVLSAVLCIGCYFILPCKTFSQNPNIKCYFNYPVNTSISSGTNAVYLYGTFPDTIAAYINRAKFTIDVALYNYTSGSTSSVAKIATAINNAAQRGVIVRWIHNGSSTNSGLTLISPIINKLASPTTTGYGLMHNKFVTIDANSTDTADAIVITGSYNWSTTQTYSDYNNLLIINNKDVAIAFYNEFNKMWGGTGIAPNIATSRFGPYKSISSQTMFNVNGTPVEVYFSPKDNSDTRLENAINTANSDLFFGIYTFTDNSVATVIKNKKNSGIVTKGIIDQFSQSYSPYSTLSPVMGNNLILYNGSDLYHNKTMVVDAQSPASDPQVCTGSYNWSNAGAHTNDENMIIIHDASIANQYLQSLCQNFAGLGGAACMPLLPLKMVSFTAILNEKKPLLQWSVASQENIEYYIVEKSTDGENFRELANVVAKPGNNAAYQYKDANGTTNSNWYRLRILAKDGSISYSKILSIKIDGQPNLQLYPNPASDQLFVQMNLPQFGIQSLKITDMTGKTILEQKIRLNSNTERVIINIAHFAPGSYLLISTGNLTPIKFVKQ